MADRTAGRKARVLPVPFQVLGALLLLTVLVTASLGMWIWAAGAGVVFVLLPLPWMAWRRLTG